MKIEVETGEIKEPYHVKSLKPHYYRTIGGFDYLIPIDEVLNFEDWIIERSRTWEDFNFDKYDQYLINSIHSIKLYIES